MGNRFLRKSSDKVFGGVCSGLAEYVGVDKSLVRILTLIGIIASGVFPGLFLYFLCVIIVPYDTEAHGGYYNGNSANNEQYADDGGYQSGGDYGEPRDTGNARFLFGSILIAGGIFLFARMFFGWLDWRYVFAGFLILCGLYILFGSRRR